MSEGLAASGRIGVKGPPHGARRHADHAGHLVARVAEAHQIERVQFPLHPGKRMGILLFLEYRQVLGGNRIAIRIIYRSSSWSIGDFHDSIERNRAGTFCSTLEKTPQALVRKTINTYPRGVYPEMIP